MMKRRTLANFVTLIACSLSAAAQNNPCERLLGDGLRNISSDSITEHNKTDYAHWMWHQSYESLGTSVNVPLFGSIIGGAFTKANFEQWRQKTSFMYARDYDRISATSILNNDLAQKYIDCIRITLTGLQITLAPFGRDEARVWLTYRAATGQDTSVPCTITITGGEFTQKAHGAEAKIQIENQRTEHFVIKRRASAAGILEPLSVTADSKYANAAEVLPAEQHVADTPGTWEAFMARTGGMPPGKAELWKVQFTRDGSGPMTMDESVELSFVVQDGGSFHGKFFVTMLDAKNVILDCAKVVPASETLPETKPTNGKYDYRLTIRKEPLEGRMFLMMVSDHNYVALADAWVTMKPRRS